MAEEKGAEAALAERIAELEKVVRQNEVLRKQTRIWSLIGVLVILILLLVFVGRLWNHVNTSYYAQIRKDPAGFVQAFIAETDITPTLQREGQMAVLQLREEIMQKFSKALFDELQKRMPEIEQKTVDMGGRLADHAKQHVEQKLNDTLADSLEKCFVEIRQTFPEFEDKELEKYIQKGQGHFVERLHDVIEDRYAKVDAHIVGLKNAVTRVKQSKGSDALSQDKQGEIAELLLDALVDLIVYELKPELGKEMAD